MHDACYVRRSHRSIAQSSITTVEVSRVNAATSSDVIYRIHVVVRERRPSSAASHRSNSEDVGTVDTARSIVSCVATAVASRDCYASSTVAQVEYRGSVRRAASATATMACKRGSFMTAGVMPWHYASPVNREASS